MHSSSGFCLQGIKAQANTSLPEHCPAPRTAPTWDETYVGGHVGIPLKLNFFTQLAEICKED